MTRALTIFAYAYLILFGVTFALVAWIFRPRWDGEMIVINLEFIVAVTALAMAAHLLRIIARDGI